MKWVWNNKPKLTLLGSVVLGKTETNQAKNFNPTEVNRTEQSMREITSWVSANNNERRVAA